MRSLVFVAWIIVYVSSLLTIRRMWTGKYVRSPLARTLIFSMVKEGESAAPEVCHWRTINIHSSVFRLLILLRAAWVRVRSRQQRAQGSQSYPLVYMYLCKLEFFKSSGGCFGLIFRGNTLFYALKHIIYTA